jgi:hypothetical protein
LYLSDVRVSCASETQSMVYQDELGVGLHQTATPIWLMQWDDAQREGYVLHGWRVQSRNARIQPEAVSGLRASGVPYCSTGNEMEN